MTFPLTSTYDLAEFSLIAGDYKELTFNVYTSGCVAEDLSGATITWYLAKYGRATADVTRSGIYTGSPVNQFKVVLSGSNTESLSGKFIQQYKIVDASGSVFKPSQGIVNISKAIS